MARRGPAEPIGLRHGLLTNVFDRPGRYAYEVTRGLVEAFGAELSHWPQGLEDTAELLFGLSRNLPHQSFRRVLESVGPMGSAACLTSQEEQFAHSVLAKAASGLEQDLWMKLYGCALVVDERRNEVASSHLGFEQFEGLLPSELVTPAARLGLVGFVLPDQDAHLA